MRPICSGAMAEVVGGAPSGHSRGMCQRVSRLVFRACLGLDQRDHSAVRPPEPGWGPGRFMHYTPTVFSFVEIIEFAARLALSAADAASMHVDVEIRGLCKRRLVSTDVMVPLGARYATERRIVSVDRRLGPRSSATVRRSRARNRSPSARPLQEAGPGHRRPGTTSGRGLSHHRPTVGRHLRQGLRKFELFSTEIRGRSQPGRTTSIGLNWKSKKSEKIHATFWANLKIIQDRGGACAKSTTGTRTPNGRISNSAAGD
jgi:hypothetical protein